MQETPMTSPKGNLDRELRTFQNVCEREWPPEAIQLIQEAIDALDPESFAQTALKVGDYIPAFTLLDQTGKSVDSEALLAQGPLLLHFYRGMW